MEELNMSNEAYLVRKRCIGGQIWWAGPVGQEHVEHFSLRFVITKKSPAFGPDYCF